MNKIKEERLQKKINKKTSTDSFPHPIFSTLDRPALLFLKDARARERETTIF